MSAPFVRRFETLSTLTGVQVIDADGRPVAERETLQSANGVAFRLNEVASTNPQALGRVIARLK